MGPPTLFAASTLVIHHLVEALAAACGGDLETTWRREAAAIMERLARLPGGDQDPGRA